MNHPVPACLQIGAANHSSAPSTAPQSRSTTPPNGIHNNTPATTANDDDSGPAHNRNPYCSVTLERSINAWLDKMVDAKCAPFNPHTGATHGWEGLPPYSEEDDEGLHGWENTKSAAVMTSKKRKGKELEMGDIMVGLEMQIDGGNVMEKDSGDLGNRDVQRGYEEWMENVGRNGGYKKLGKRY